MIRDVNLSGGAPSGRALPRSTSRRSFSISQPAPSRLRSEHGGTWFSVLAVLGCFAIFVIILWLAYLPQRRATPPVDLSTVPEEEQWRYTPAGREARLAELRAQEQADATSYAWIDREKGVVRLPLDRAMELAVRELNAGRGNQRGFASDHGTKD